MSHSSVGCASMARCTFPTSARRTISQCWVPSATGAPLVRSPSSARGSRWFADRASHRGAPLHPGADQTARDFRRSGRDCHRERAAVQGIEVRNHDSLKHWSSGQQPVKFCALSHVRRPIFSLCWILSQRTPPAFVTPRRFDWARGRKCS